MQPGALEKRFLSKALRPSYQVGMRLSFLIALAAALIAQQPTVATDQNAVSFTSSMYLHVAVYARLAIS